MDFESGIFPGPRSSLVGLIPGISISKPLWGNFSLSGSLKEHVEIGSGAFDFPKSPIIDAESMFVVSVILGLVSLLGCTTEAMEDSLVSFGDESMCLTKSSNELSRSVVTGAGFGGEYAGGFAGLIAGGLRLSGGFHTGNLAVSKTESNSSLGIPEGAELWEASDPATDPGVSRPRLWSKCDLWSPWCASCFLSRG